MKGRIIAQHRLCSIFKSRHSPALGDGGPGPELDCGRVFDDAGLAAASFHRVSMA